MDQIQLGATPVTLISQKTSDDVSVQVQCDDTGALYVNTTGPAVAEQAALLGEIRTFLHGVTKAYHVKSFSGTDVQIKNAMEAWFASVEPAGIDGVIPVDLQGSQKQVALIWYEFS